MVTCQRLTLKMAPMNATLTLYNIKNQNCEDFLTFFTTDSASVIVPSMNPQIYTELEYYSAFLITINENTCNLTFNELIMADIAAHSVQTSETNTALAKTFHFAQKLLLRFMLILTLYSSPTSIKYFLKSSSLH